MAPRKLLSALLLLILGSCSKDDPAPEQQDQIPDPLSCVLKTYGNSERLAIVTIDRNDDGDVVKVAGGPYDSRDELTYAGERIIKVTRYLPPTQIKIIDFAYDDSGQIKTTRIYPQGKPELANQTNFTFDENGKLAKKEFLTVGILEFTIRYEYEGIMCRRYTSDIGPIPKILLSKI
ncbi:MAG: hypothetical protein ABIS36_19040 [Chryseolinea sp.]